MRSEGLRNFSIRASDISNLMQPQWPTLSFLLPYTLTFLNNIAVPSIAIDHKLPTFTTLNQISDMENQQFDLGMIGLGVMGSNLLLNMADHGLKSASMIHRAHSYTQNR